MAATPKPHRTIPRLLVHNLVNELVRKPYLRKVTHFENETLTVKVARRHKPDRRARRVEFVLTIGAPNYAERKTIKAVGGKGRLRGARTYSFYPAKKRGRK